jgi:hypothetical protein
MRTSFLGLLFFRIPSEHKAVHTGILYWRINRDSPTRRQLVELPDLVLVAEAVAPPPAQVVDAIALHALEKLPSAV